MPVSQGVFLNATQSNGCNCDNFVLEAHYRVFFTNETEDTFSISQVVVDVVYGSTANATCFDTVITLKTSVQFLQNADSRLQSGSPGYVKGRPILLGASQPVTVNDASGNA